MRISRRLLMGLAFSAPLPALARTALSPDSDVPANHWAYDALQMCIQLGLADDPFRGTYSGKPAFTRRQFAGFTSDLAEGGEWFAQRGWPERPRYVMEWQGLDAVARLAREFDTELGLIGVDRVRFEQSLDRFARVWQDGLPQGIRVPLLRPVHRFDRQARLAGRAEARDAWARGERYLYTTRAPVTEELEVKRAIPLKVVATPEGDRLGMQRLAGYNEEMWHQFHEKGFPSDSPLTWTHSLFDVARMWRTLNKPLVLDSEHPGAVVPDSDYRLVWDVQHPSNRERWTRLGKLPDGRLALPAHVPQERRDFVMSHWSRGDTSLQIPADHIVGGQVELAWGPRGSGVACIRVRVDDHDKPHRIYAVDLRTGDLLAAAATG